MNERFPLLADRLELLKLGLARYPAESELTKRNGPRVAAEIKEIETLLACREALQKLVEGPQRYAFYQSINVVAEDLQAAKALLEGKA